VRSGSDARQHDPEQVEEYVKNGAQPIKEASCNYAKVTRAGTGGREYETGATYRVMDDAEPARTDRIGTGVSNRSHYPAKPR
jgi:hypothetical protein